MKFFAYFLFALVRECKLQFLWFAWHHPAASRPPSLTSFSKIFLMVSPRSALFLLPCLAASLLMAAATSVALGRPTIAHIGGGVSPGPFAGSIIALTADGNAVTGQAFNDTATTAFRWTRSGGLQVIGSLPGGSNGAVTGISANGSVICGAEFSLNAVYRWTSAGGFVDIGSLPGPQGFFFANGISTGASAIVGISGTPSGDRAFRLTNSDGMQSLGTLPGGSSSLAMAVSGDGSTVTGSSESAQGARVFECTSSGKMQDLGILPASEFCSDTRISVDGSAIVGWCANDLRVSGLLWTPTLRVANLSNYLPSIGLNLTGWTIHFAKAISVNGSVIAGDGTFNGEFRSLTSAAFRRPVRQPP